jgi:para-aminobenzoate synthetase component 1
LVEELIPCPDVMEALAAFSDERDVVLFESALHRPGVGRYSFLTARPFKTVEVARVAYGSDPLARVRWLLNRYPAETIPDLPPFQGGAAGVLGYELGGAWEQVPRSPADEFQLPDLVIGLFDWVLAWDHQQRRCWIISHGFSSRSKKDRTDWAAKTILRVRDRLSRASKRPIADFSNTQSRPPSPLQFQSRQWPVPGFPGLLSDFSREGYLKTVARVIEYIFAGDIFQANLSQRLVMESARHPLELYQRLRRFNPAPFAAYFAHDDWAIASASPERFLRVSEGTVETRPIKGTRRRQLGAEADLFTRDALRESEKDQAENVMIVDLLRNDLSRVCQPGSLRVPALCSVETYETVQHLVSEIRGELADHYDVWDLWAAAFPGGSITGAPKVRAMEIISELEPTVRGPYCGSLFYAGFNGETDSSILIRTLISRHGFVQCSVGGGIVAQSDPVAEYEETWHKAEAMLRAL